MTMKFGMHLPQMGPHTSRTTNLTYARRVEALGYDSIWVSDHVVIPYRITSRYPGSANGEFPMSPQTDFLDPMVLLGLVAACTERVHMGLSVMVLPHRPAVITAKMLATIDRLSEGRLLIGTGVGWMQEELAALGAPYHQRGALSDEYLEAMITLWTEEASSYQGTFVNFAPIGCYPKPVQQPHPPLLIGGHSPAAFRRVARFGQGWHAVSAPPDVLVRQLGTIHQEMRQVGRDPSELDVSLRVTFHLTDDAQPDSRSRMHGSAQQLIDDIRAYEQAGVHHLVLFFAMGRRVDPIGTIERFADQVLTAFR
jgi:probable F420-dependent oxidoreductase